MPNKSIHSTKKTNPIIGLLVVVGIIVSIIGIILLIDSTTGVKTIGSIQTSDYPGIGIAALFSILGLVPLLWAVVALLISFIVQPLEVKKMVRFIAISMVATGLGLAITGVLSGTVTYILTKLFPAFEQAWIALGFVLALFVIIRSGPIVMKTVFSRSNHSRSLVDNSYLFGGMRMAKRKKTRK